MSAPRTTAKSTRQLKAVPAKPAATKAAPRSRRTTAKPAAEVVADLKAVESGDKPSGSVVAKVTGPNSMHTAAKAPAKRATKAKPAPKKATTEKLSTDADEIPTDPTQLRKLIKITRDRRWRAGRRGDAELVHAMNVKLEALTGTPFTPDAT